MTGLQFKDTQCGFKLYKKNHAKKLFKSLSEFGYIHDVEIILLSQKNKIKSHRQDLSDNLINKGVEDISEFKRVYGYNQGLLKAIEIINETSQKYQKGEIDDE